MSGICIHCGTTISPGALDGLCPVCVAGRLGGGKGSSGGPVPARIGAYEVISELGRGGMGVVYLARQAGLDRLVAVKVLLAGVHGGEEAERRFVSEARSAAQLQHPNIVRLLEAGRSDGVSFYSMELIEGEDLGERVSRRRLEPRAAAEILAMAARAVAHAHQLGLVHRDVKPSNILLDAADVPHLTDFGLALPLESRGWLTQPGAALGTPAYMAPEQLAGEATVQSDVYALGAVLYFCLTGRPPFTASKLPDLLRSIQDEEPLSPERLDASIPRDLGILTLKALQKSPQARYASALAFAEDLENWLAGRPIKAKPRSHAARLFSWCRRNRALSASLAFAAVISLGGATTVLWQWKQVTTLAEKRERELYAATLKLASESLAHGDLGLAEDRLNECPPSLRDAAWGLLKAGSAGDERAVAGETRHTVVDLALAPDGRTLASARQIDPVKIWNLNSKTEYELPGTEFSWSVGFTPDGASLVTADTHVKVWSLARRTVSLTLPGRSAVLSPDGQSIAACEGHRFLYEGEPGPVSVWDLKTGLKRYTIDEPVRLMCWSHDGKRLLLGDGASTLFLHDASTGARLGQPWAAGGGAWSLAFSPDDSWIVASGWTRDVRVWPASARSGAPVTLPHPLSTWGARFSADGRQLAVGCSDRCIYIWDTATWTLRKTLRGHRDEVWAVEWADAQHLLSAGRDLTVYAWTTLVKPTRDLFHSDPAYSPVWLPEDRLLVLDGKGEGRASQVLRLPGGESESSAPGTAPAVFDSGTGDAFVWTQDFALRILNRTATASPACGETRFEARDEMADLPRLQPLHDLAWGPSTKGDLLFWKVSTGRLLDRWRLAFKAPLRAGALSPDGRYFAWGAHSKELTLVDRASGKESHLAGHTYEVDCVAFSPDSRLMVSAGVEGNLLLWDTESGASLGVLGVHRTSAGRVAFSPDGRIVAALEPGIGVHLWHVPTRREVALLPLTDQENDEWLQFSPDGRWLGTRATNGLLHLFPIATLPKTMPAE